MMILLSTVVIPDPAMSAYAQRDRCCYAALERLITDGCVVVSTGVACREEHQGHVVNSVALAVSASQPMAVLEPPVVLFMSAK